MTSQMSISLLIDQITPNTEPRNAQVLQLMLDKTMKVNKGETVRIPVHCSQCNDVFGFQWTLSANGLTFVEIEGNELDISKENIAVMKDGLLTMSYHSDKKFGLTDGDKIFTLVFKATSDGTIDGRLLLNSDITPNEVYFGDALSIGRAAIHYQTKEVEYDFSVDQNFPNPFQKETTIQFVLPDDGEVTVTIHDPSGHTCFVRTMDGKKGINNLMILDKDVQNMFGVFNYPVQQGEFTETKKMIHIR